MLFGEDYRFEFGKALLMRPGRDATILACGFMVHKALEAAEELALEGIEAEVLNLHTIKPLDKEGILESASRTEVITCEEHPVLGGMGGAVAELLGRRCPCPCAWWGPGSLRDLGICG